MHSGFCCKCSACRRLPGSTCWHSVCQQKGSFPTNYLVARFRPELVNAQSLTPPGPSGLRFLLSHPLTIHCHQSVFSPRIHTAQTGYNKTLHLRRAAFFNYGRQYGSWRHSPCEWCYNTEAFYFISLTTQWTLKFLCCGRIAHYSAWHSEHYTPQEWTNYQLGLYLCSLYDIVFNFLAKESCIAAE